MFVLWCNCGTANGGKGGWSERRRSLCPWNGEAVLEASMNGHADVMQWLTGVGPGGMGGMAFI